MYGKAGKASLGEELTPIAVEAGFSLINNTSKSRSKIPRLVPNLARSPEVGGVIIREVKEMLDTMPLDWDPHMKLEFCKVCIRTVVERQQTERKKKEKTEEEFLNEDLKEAIGILESNRLTESRTNHLIEQIE